MKGETKMAEKTYKVDCHIHEVRIVYAESEKEAREKAYNDDYAINEIMDFKTEVIDEWED